MYLPCSAAFREAPAVRKRSEIFRQPFHENRAAGQAAAHRVACCVTRNARNPKNNILGLNNMLEEFLGIRGNRECVTARQLNLLWPSRPKTLYSITLSSNHATHLDAYEAYEYVISRFPTGEFYYIHERSPRGKYHIHGIVQFKYNFSYRNLMASRSTESKVYPHRYDIHIRFDELDKQHFENYIKYMTKAPSAPIIRDAAQLQVSYKPVRSCIPVVQIKTYYRKIVIK